MQESSVTKSDMDLCGRLFGDSSSSLSRRTSALPCITTSSSGLGLWLGASNWLGIILLALWLLVVLRLEVQEECQHGGDVDHVHDNHWLWGSAALHGQEGNTLSLHEAELRQLGIGDHLLDWSWDVHVEGSRKVIAIHDEVNGAIQDNAPVGISIIVALDVQPVEEKDGEVVVHMQEGHLTPVALDDHEGCVNEVEGLGQVEAVGDVSKALLSQVVLIAHQREATSPVFLNGSVDHPSTEDHLGCVVDGHGSKHWEAFLLDLFTNCELFLLSNLISSGLLACVQQELAAHNHSQVGAGNGNCIVHAPEVPVILVSCTHSDISGSWVEEANHICIELLPEGAHLSAEDSINHG